MGGSHLRLVDDTGEVRRDLQPYEEVQALYEEIDRKYKGLLLENRNLKKELRDLQAVEPEREKVIAVHDYWADRMVEIGAFKRRPGFKAGNHRCQSIRARLKDRFEDREPYTVEELKLVVDGAILSKDHAQKRDWLDAKSIFLDSTRVDLHIERALAEREPAGRWDEFLGWLKGETSAKVIPLRPVAPRPVVPVVAADEDEQAGYVAALRSNDLLHRRLLELKGWPLATLCDDTLSIGWDQGQRRVTFPMFGAEGSVLTGWRRYRPGGEPKMLGDKGVRAELFPPPECLPVAGELWLVEGEPDVLSAHAMGWWPACGVPGAQSWKAEWAERLRSYALVHVVFDADEAGRTAAARVAADLEAVDGIEVDVIELAAERSDGFDVGDLFLSGCVAA